MTEKRKSPALRFRGYTDDWEQRKVSDLAEKTYGGGTPTTSNEAYWNGDIPWIQSSDVMDGKLLGVEPRKWITQAGLNNSAAQLIPENSIAIITRVGVGKLAFMPYAYATSQDFLSLSKLNAEPLFTVYACYKELQTGLNAVQGTSIKGITKDELLVKNIMVPRYAEQQQIGALFKNLDHLITLHQRKLEKLKLVKKSMLEKMFPKNGSSVPEIRFNGFTDDWEQRKLGEILQERNTRTSDFESNPLYSLTIESGVTPKTDRYERSSLVTKTEDLFKIVKPNEFVTNPMNLRFGALGYNRNAFTVSVSGYYDVFSIDDDKCSGFWNSYFKTLTAMNIFDNAATGSLIEKRRVKYSTLQQLAFYMPNDLSEKAEIGKYMDTFDNLITLHQRKVEKLQIMKKSMLEKMFV